MRDKSGSYRQIHREQDGRRQKETISYDVFKKSRNIFSGKQIQKNQGLNRPEKEKKAAPKKWCLVLLGILLLFIAAGGAFWKYTSDDYQATKKAIAVEKQDTDLTDAGNYIVLKGDSTAADYQKDRALLFYPGGKVEYTAYLPLLQKFQKQGMTCVLVKMPFNLAVLDPDAADAVIKKMPEIKHWYMAGHSLGGAIASSYVAKHEKTIEGLILMGAYNYKEAADSQKTLILYGDRDKVLNRSKILSTDNSKVIAGGNHAQFGNYGVQKNDGKASISADKQQDLTVRAAMEWIDDGTITIYADEK